MVTLWPIPEEAREVLEDGQSIKLKSPGKYGDVVIAFAKDYPKAFECEWEPEENWDHFK